MASYPVANGSVISLSLIGKHENQEVMTVLHYRLSAGGTIDDGVAVINAFIAQAATNEGLVDSWRECLSVKAIALRGVAQWIAPSRFALVPFVIVPGTGAVAGDAMPVNTACAITRRTQFSGRRHVGTIHMPAVPLTFIANGNLTALAEEKYNTFATKTLQVLTIDFPPAEFYPIPFNRVNPELAQQFVTFALQPTARVERRRTVGLGT